VSGHDHDDVDSAPFFDPSAIDESDPRFANHAEGEPFSVASFDAHIDDLIIAAGEFLRPWPRMIFRVTYEQAVREAKIGRRKREPAVFMREARALSEAYEDREGDAQALAFKTYEHMRPTLREEHRNHGPETWWSFLSPERKVAFVRALEAGLG
jgi:hypothetical protein